MSMKTIAVLGSTGSIGRQTLEVLRAHPELGRVGALCVHGNVELLLAQALAFRPAFVGIADEDAADALRPYLPEGTHLEVGPQAATVAAALTEVDTVVNGVSGFAGTEPLLAALRAQKTVALANKESIVCAHKLVDEALGYGGKIVPVDSEQSAIFQCLCGGAHSEVKRLWLTASGGPFRGKNAEELKSVTLSQALNHPRWKMGNKITIDSATLMNKGFEVIEAKWLFGAEAESIDVVVHPESIVHSMVEYCDGAVMAQLGIPDMAIPISLALEYPDRLPNRLPRLDLKTAGTLTFEAPDMETFPCLKLAYDALKEGKTYCAALNAANEVAVEAFLREQIAFRDIPECLDEVLQRHNPSGDGELESILLADEEARRVAKRILEV